MKKRIKPMSPQSSDLFVGGRSARKMKPEAAAGSMRDHRDRNYAVTTGRSSSTHSVIVISDGEDDPSPGRLFMVELLVIRLTCII